MSHDNSTNHPGDETEASAEVMALAAFLRELATRAERDPAFAAGVLAIARASGLIPQLSDQPMSQAAQQTPAQPTRKAKTSASANAGKAGKAADTQPTMPPDPFKVMRAKGEVGLRATLDALDLSTLRVIVRAHRLDPARISARWTNRDRVIALIIEQTRARLNHGKAFDRV